MLSNVSPIRYLVSLESKMQNFKSSQRTVEVHVNPQSLAMRLLKLYDHQVVPLLSRIRALFPKSAVPDVKERT